MNRTINRLANEVIAAGRSEKFMGIDVRPFKDRDQAARDAWLDDLEKLIHEWWSASPVKTIKKNRQGLRIHVDLRQQQGDLTILIKGRPVDGFTVDVNGRVGRFFSNSSLYKDVMIWIHNRSLER